MNNNSKRRFDIPTQVAFWDTNENHYANVNHYVGGIAWGDKIICGCCGEVMEIDEIYKFAPDGIVPIRDYDWIDINDEIIGGVNPMEDPEE